MAPDSHSAPDRVWAARQAVAALLAWARTARDGRVIRGPLGIPAWSAALANTAAFARARDAVAAAGGADLDADALWRTGVAGLVASDADVDVERVAEQLVAWLTRAEVGHWQAVGVDLAELPPVWVDGWQGWTPDAADLADCAPVPDAAAHQTAMVWPPGSTRHAFWRRRLEPVDPAMAGASPVTAHPQLAAWLPVFVTAAHTRARVRAPLLVDVFDGHSLRAHGDRVPLELTPADPADPDSDPVETPWGDDPPIADPVTLQRFADAVTARYHGLGELGETTVQRRFERAAQHVVMAAAASDPLTVPDPRVRDEVLLHYVVALDAVLAERDQRSLRKTIARRAEMLLRDEPVAAGGTGRRGGWAGGWGAGEVYAHVAAAYDARTRYVHGEETGAPVRLSRLRDVVVAVLVRWLVAVHAHAAARGGADPRPDRALFTALNAVGPAPAARQRAVGAPLARFTGEVSGQGPPP